MWTHAIPNFQNCPTKNNKAGHLDVDSYFITGHRVCTLSTPPKFNSSPLKNGAWKTILSYWVSVTFQGRTVKLRECNICFPCLHAHLSNFVLSQKLGFSVSKICKSFHPLSNLGIYEPFISSQWKLKLFYNFTQMPLFSLFLLVKS